MEYEERIDQYRENFKEHEIQTIEDGKHVKIFKFAKPGTNTFSFTLVCSDNLIAMTGDCYPFMSLPGHGRDGLSFLRGAINSLGYFLEKCPESFLTSEYCSDYAMELLVEEVKSEVITQDQLDGCYGLDEGEVQGEAAYYEFCYSNDIEEPSRPRILKSSTLNQIAGLRCFVEKYEQSLEEIAAT